MFERYTESARKAIFFGRYEASVFGSNEIEVEHLLLGVLRADADLSIRVFHTQKNIDTVRHRITLEAPRAEKRVSTSVDLPLSDSCKRVLSLAVEDASRRNQSFVSAGHLLLGIAQEPSSLAARLVLESGVTIAALQAEASRAKQLAAATSAGTEQRFESSAPSSTRSPQAANVSFEPQGQGPLDLVAEAREGRLEPLIGRARELNQLLQVLSRRTRNSVVLLGEPGVGKESIVRGLARLIADENVPADLMGRPVLRVDAFDLTRALASSRSANPFILRAVQESSGILYVRGLFDRREVVPELANFVRSGRLRVITTGSPLSFRQAVERNEELARSFEPLGVLPATNTETIEILNAAKASFEAFHSVVVSAEAIQMAVAASERFLPQRALPERALDLLDDAGALVRVRRESLPPELAALQKACRLIEREEDQAVGNHDFEAAKALSNQQREMSARIESLREELQSGPHRSDNVTGDNVLEVIAARTSLTVAQVKAVLSSQPQSGPQDKIRKELAALIPVGRRDWIDGLLSYLIDCSTEDADRLLNTLRSAHGQ